MKEIYKNTSQFVNLDLYGASADADPVAITTRDGVQFGSALAVTPGTAPDGATQRWRAYLPLSATQEQGNIEVVWTFSAGGEAATVVNDYLIVTPLVTVEDARAELEIPSTISDTKIRRQERMARAVIESYCGQSFGKEHGFETVYGSGPTIQLPRRIVKLTGVNYGLYTAPANLYTIVGNGFYIHGYNNDWDVSPEGGVIVVPGEGGYINFVDGVAYEIEGDWGWDDVPVPVSDAAKLLIEQALCPDAIYRERGIGNVRAADWRYEFRDEAYIGTGNVLADELLQNYRINQMVVI